MNRKDALLEMLVRLGDDHLVLGHRLSEWCGHAPMLEEDLSMPNMALDLIGQARNLYSYAGEVEGKGRDEDAIAYLRLEHQYKNLLLVEQPNTDFAVTMLRQFYFATFMELFWSGALESSDKTVGGIAGKAVKEIAYHVRHTGEWIIRMGDGTQESHRRMVSAIEQLHCYSDEMFEVDEIAIALNESGIFPLASELKPAWLDQVKQVFNAANLELPEHCWPQTGGRKGSHGEAIGYLLADLQYMQRTYPGMTW